ncbi:ATP-binding protein [uncultured Tateyamaria sp.]|uniref:ATP-binding protein n=1 Tax=uncultured Tateyamaria sp. TaxID=455651 RepID=UPI002614879A|nr:ATP-binding protein [uncultured Tateyamaria sp.]
MSFKWLKRYMPRGIYARAALILLLPVVVVQLVVSVVFVKRHFEEVSHQMSQAAAREVRLVLASIESAPRRSDITETSAAVATPLAMTVTPLSESALDEPHQRAWYDFSGIVITDRLGNAVPEVEVVDLSNDRRVRLVLDTTMGAVEVSFDRRRVSAAAPHQLFVNMLFFSVLVTLIAFIFLRNQLRPIKRLARAADAFGRGRVMPYSPSGATELRAAGAAFVDMRNRIERQIETRTLMLSGVSHDLRTPLTRMKLSLSMLDDDERIPMERDVEDMQRMIDAFLSFAKGDSEDEPQDTDPIALVRTLVEDAQRGGQPVTLVECEGAGEMPLRVMAIRRALDNLVSNAVRYGTRAEVSVLLTDTFLRFRVEDDGPGIAEDDYADAQRPFTRLDSARNQDKGSGVGLGLAIATDIARAHGGVLRLGRSEQLGGLRADIVIGR